MTYLLTPSVRAWTWKRWKRWANGSVLCGYARRDITNVFGPEGTHRWDMLTLGQLADVSVLADREMARYAVEIREQPSMGTREYLDEGVPVTRSEHSMEGKHYDAPPATRTDAT